MSRVSATCNECVEGVSGHLPEDLKKRIVQSFESYGAAVEDLRLQVTPGERDLRDVVRALKSAGRDCNRLARDTSDLCERTVIKGSEIVDFGREVKATLVGIAQNMDASTLATIRDLIGGGNARAARTLAVEMEGIALACVEKSVAMITRMQDGVDALPKAVKGAVKRAAKKIEASEEETVVVNVEKDIAELRACANAIRHVNLFTAMEAGENAFDGVALKSELCKSLFESIRRFAEAIATITDAFLSHDVSEVVSKVKDMLRCIRLGGLIKRFAEEARKVIKGIINLFRETSHGLSRLWSALAFAKDCLSDCASQAQDTKKLCKDARERGVKLVEKSNTIKLGLEGICSLRKSKSLSGSISLIRSVIDGRDIRDAIDLATGMEDLVGQCAQNVFIMVKRVTEGYENLPGIITDGIPDMKGAGKADEDPLPANIENDISDLDRARECIENADVFSSARAGLAGFTNVVDKAVLCGEMINRSECYADSSIATIDSFMGTWNLEAAMDKIMDICHLVRLGEMLKQLTGEIVRLLHSHIALMKALGAKLDRIPGHKILTEDIQGAIGRSTHMIQNIRLSRK